ncbi:hypothetical protein F5Y15DRAFT_195448 [Xylariaceae sp. FL0016]|nr:hypothetical protein F5Y15DRAFT_195448 [Xylariaceae sp. FL0016]
MASSSMTTPDTLITLKVNLDGVTRRTKLPLRDLGAHTLEDKVRIPVNLRCFLQIPVGVRTTVERYSDSAATYVKLESSNTSVFKQLYRAAKAKQKLKLRVTTYAEPKANEQSNKPKPATVEDEPEDETTKESTERSLKSPTPIPSATVVTSAGSPAGTLETISAPQAPEDFASFVSQWRSRGMPRIHLRRDTEGTEVVDFLDDASPCKPMVTLAPLVEGTSPTSEYKFSQTASQLPFASLFSEAHQKEKDDAIANFQALAAVRQKELREAQRRENTDVFAKLEVMTSAPPKIYAASVEEKKPETNGHENQNSAYLKRPFTVCCNSCDQAVPSAHFHCSICDDGDFDLCQSCVNRGITCYGDGHWLIKRTILDGQIKCSTTHIAPKSERSAANIKSKNSSVDAFTVPAFPRRQDPEFICSLSRTAHPVHDTTGGTRTCNCCVQEFSDREFVHCTSCDDYDLCKGCFAKNAHGHHPKHGFVPAVKGTVFEHSISSRLSAGRNIVHNAICDGCETYVRGVRHKCLDCPDWDYCSNCVMNASATHAGHRFVAVYEPLADRTFRSFSKSVHYGICCDGPLCTTRHGGSKYIEGERYKCAVCNDTDFCANCESSPDNTHNKTHPLIKFKTPVRHVSVTTTGEHEDGQRLPTMGDRSGRTRRRLTPNTASARESIAATPVQTVVDVQPTVQQSVAEKKEALKEPVDTKKEIVDSVTTIPSSVPQQVPAKLIAIFKRDTVADGTVLPRNQTFEQTWVLRNEGTTPWPAGCSVKFVGGDYMGAVDPTHPAGIHELVSASESTICYNALNPGQECAFTVLMRTPDRDGKVISYWRLSTREGEKFGHKLWCDVTVQGQVPQVKPTTVVKSEPEVEHRSESVVDMAKSHMIIPRLEHESPSASIHEGRPNSETETETETETDTLAPSPTTNDENEFEECADDEDWADDSEDGFLTDEEYDILDASDEEYLSEQQRLMSKK